MLKKIKWILLGLAAIMIIIGTYVVSLVRYAEGEVTALDNYEAAILALQEVDSIASIHRFNGLESYIVANIEHENGRDFYYFVREGEVQHLFIASELINEPQANEIAQDLVGDGEIIFTQLGILEETPIFEVQIEFEDSVRYIVIDAQTSEVILDFPVDGWGI